MIDYIFSIHCKFALFIKVNHRIAFQFELPDHAYFPIAIKINFATLIGNALASTKGVGCG